jgi:hypothetical protein
MSRLRKTMITVFLMILFLIPLPYQKQKTAKAVTILGFNFTEDGWNAALLSAMASIQALNEVSNSRLFNMLGEVSEMKKSINKVVEISKKVFDYYHRGERVYELSAAVVWLYSEYYKTVAEVAKYSELLSPEEMTFLVKIMDYVVFSSSNIGTGTTKRETSTVAGGIIGEASQLMNFFVDAKNEQSAMNIKMLMDNAETVLRKTVTDLTVTQKYVYAFLNRKRYNAGVYDMAAVRRQYFHNNFYDGPLVKY